eukprot:9478104-Pyramimonas_sp.AAC.1
MSKHPRLATPRSFQLSAVRLTQLILSELRPAPIAQHINHPATAKRGGVNNPTTRRRRSPLLHFEGRETARHSRALVRTGLGV